MIVLLLLGFIFCNAEARVYCQDRHATSWTSIGHACTITCKTVLSAVERLKQSDYQHLVNEHGLYTLEMSNMSHLMDDMERKERRHMTADETYEQTYEAFMKIAPTQQFLTDFKDQMMNITNVLNRTCYRNANRSRLLRKVLNDCTPSYMPRGYIFNNFIAFLNQHAHKENQFDSAMTLIILKHLLSNVNISDEQMAETLVQFLKRELRPHVKRLSCHRKETISLTSKDCMSLFVPGCYCIKGYVEDSGRCQKPEKCSEDPTFLLYLKRVYIF